jgi:hypothetical protein
MVEVPETTVLEETSKIVSKGVCPKDESKGELTWALSSGDGQSLGDALRAGVRRRHNRRGNALGRRSGLGLA